MEYTNSEKFFKLSSIGDKFRLPGKLYAYELITNGNINMTIKVTYMQDNGKVKIYIFQRINTSVFKNPENIMENIDNVTSHIHKKYPDEIYLHFHHTENGNNYCYDEEHYFWRVMDFIDSITYNTCDDLSVIAATGEAFGHFQMQLSDFDGSILHETIPDFHNTYKRLLTLLGHVAENPMNRNDECSEELSYIWNSKEKASKLSVMYNEGKMPVRVTHNDTKSNNVLFDRVTKRPIVVIDLDTVMPGMAIYDFADAVRFICNTSAEDEPDISKVYFDTSKFRAFCKGYLKEVKDSLKQEELDNLVLATFSITIELASRFLDDYLCGDTYFKVNYPGHNLVRTRCQLALAKDVERKYEELCWIVRDVISNLSN